MQKGRGRHLVVAGDEGGQIRPLLVSGGSAPQQVLQVDVGQVEEVGLRGGDRRCRRQLLGQRLGCVQQRVCSRALLRLIPTAQKQATLCVRLYAACRGGIVPCPWLPEIKKETESAAPYQTFNIPGRVTCMICVMCAWES